MPLKQVIINADDYGHNINVGVCEGILKAYKFGIVTSTTVQVDFISKPQINSLIKSRLPFGLHVRENAQRELDQFLAIFGHLPTHLDSHRFKMYTKPYRNDFYSLARKYNLPIRKPAIPVASRGVFDQNFHQIVYPKDLKTTNYAIYGYIDTIADFLKVLRQLKPGTTEIMVHVSVSAENLRFEHMTRQLAVLTDTIVKKEIERLNIALISFKDLWKS